MSWTTPKTRLTRWGHFPGSATETLFNLILRNWSTEWRDPVICRSFLSSTIICVCRSTRVWKKEKNIYGKSCKERRETFKRTPWEKRKRSAIVYRWRDCANRTTGEKEGWIWMSVVLLLVVSPLLLYLSEIENTNRSRRIKNAKFLSSLQGPGIHVWMYIDEYVDQDGVCVVIALALCRVEKVHK